LKKSTAQVEAARTVIRAVNAKDSKLYVSVFAENAVVQLYSGPVRVTGRQMLEENRRRHFALYPHIRSEIQHLVQIGDTVVMHDRVWLNPDTEAPVDVVEIYSFGEDGLISKIDVIQPQKLPPAIDE